MNIIYLKFNIHYLKLTEKTNGQRTFISQEDRYIV